MWKFFIKSQFNFSTWCVHYLKFEFQSYTMPVVRNPCLLLLLLFHILRKSGKSELSLCKYSCWYSLSLTIFYILSNEATKKPEYWLKHHIAIFAFVPGDQLLRNSNASKFPVDLISLFLYQSVYFIAGMISYIEEQRLCRYSKPQITSDFVQLESSALRVWRWRNRISSRHFLHTYIYHINHG